MLLQHISVEDSRIPAVQVKWSTFRTRRIWRGLIGFAFLREEYLMHRTLIAFGLSLAMPMLGFCQTPRRVAIRAGHLIDGKSDKPLENALIVIEGDKIVSVVAGGRGPAGVGVGGLFKATGLPGCIDAHPHLLLQCERASLG